MIDQGPCRSGAALRLRVASEVTKYVQRQESLEVIHSWTNATLSMDMDEVDKRARAQEAKEQVLHARLRAVSDEVKGL
jgi:hypothetical protein